MTATLYGGGDDVPTTSITTSIPDATGQPAPTSILVTGRWWRIWRRPRVEHEGCSYIFWGCDCDINHVGVYSRFLMDVDLLMNTVQQVLKFVLLKAEGEISTHWVKTLTYE